MSDRSDRWYRVMQEGARELNGEAWSALVIQAAKCARGNRACWSSFEASDPTVSAPRHIAVDPQMVLDLERALVEADQLHEELTRLIDEDWSAARSARLKRKLESAIVSVQRAIRSRGGA